MQQIFPDLTKPLPQAGDPPKNALGSAAIIGTTEPIRYPSKFGDVEVKGHPGLQPLPKSAIENLLQQQAHELQLPPLPIVNLRPSVVAQQQLVHVQSTATASIETQLIYAKRLIMAALTHYNSEDFHRLYDHSH